MKTSPLNDGTTGKRFSWGLYRKRSCKARYGVKFGPTMVGINAGTRSLYIERKNPVKFLHNFGG